MIYIFCPHFKILYLFTIYINGAFFSSLNIYIAGWSLPGYSWFFCRLIPAIHSTVTNLLLLLLIGPKFGLRTGLDGMLNHFNPLLPVVHIHILHQKFISPCDNVSVMGILCGECQLIVILLVGHNSEMIFIHFSLTIVYQVKLKMILLQNIWGVWQLSKPDI